MFIYLLSTKAAFILTQKHKAPENVRGLSLLSEPNELLPPLGRDEQWVPSDPGASDQLVPRTFSDTHQLYVLILLSLWGRFFGANYTIALPLSKAPTFTFKGRFHIFVWMKSWGNQGESRKIVMWWQAGVHLQGGLKVAAAPIKHPSFLLNTAT